MTSVPLLAAISILVLVVTSGCGAPTGGTPTGRPAVDAARDLLRLPPTPPPGFPGFEGPDGYYLTSLPNKGKVVLLEPTVSATREGDWRAWGLVRNETSRAVGTVTVHAKLFDSSGGAMASASAEVPVHLLRSGEPGPFTLGASIPAKDVARVEWEVEAAPASGEWSRDLDVQVYWQVPFGVKEWKGVARQGPPYPHTAALGLENLGVPLRTATATMAWLERGQVVWVETTSLDPVSRLPIPTEGSTNFRKIDIADPLMERYETLRPMFLYSAAYLLWGQGQP